MTLSIWQGKFYFINYSVLFILKPFLAQSHAWDSLHWTEIGKNRIHVRNLYKSKTSQRPISEYFGTAHVLLNNFGMRLTNHFLLSLADISPLSHSLGLFGDKGLTRTKNKLLRLALTVTKKTILINWKSKNKTSSTQ